MRWWIFFCCSQWCTTNGFVALTLPDAGDVYIWGLFNGDAHSVPFKVEFEKATKITQLACGTYHVMALDG